MKDILLTNDNDIAISETGDISLTDSVRQAVRIRLLWFLNEWRFAPSYGLPYWEEILVKNPILEKVRRAIRDEVLSVDEVTDAKNITISMDKKKRSAWITLDVITTEKTYREEVTIHV